MALDASTGEVAWKYPTESRLESVVVDHDSLVIATVETLPDRRLKPLLSWIDLQSGLIQKQAGVDVGERNDLLLGPTFSAGHKWYSFVGRTWKEPKRELRELILASPADRR
jgi:hypothetical protein